MQTKQLTPRLALAAALLLSGLAHAQVSVQDAWVRATVPQQKATGAFMRLRNLCTTPPTRSWRRVQGQYRFVGWDRNRC